MLRRASLVLGSLSLLALAGCQSPCGRVASAICTIPGEEASCRFLRDLPSDNEPAQAACKELKGPAEAYALEPDSTMQKVRWTAAAVALRGVGLAGDVLKAGKAAGDAAKGGAEDAERLAREAADRAGEAAKDVEKAAREVGEALRGKE